jgi:acetylglutamate kinase
MVVNLASTGSNVRTKNVEKEDSARDLTLCAHKQARCYVVNGGGQIVPAWLAAKKKGERRKKKTGDEGQGIRLIQVCWTTLADYNDRSDLILLIGL